MSNFEISFIRLSEAASLIAVSGLSLEDEISAEILTGSGVISQFRISRLERVNAPPLSLFWFKSPEGSTGSDNGPEFGLNDKIYRPPEVTLEVFLRKFLGCPADIANFFDLLFRTISPALKLQKDRKFCLLLTTFCELQAAGKIRSFHLRGMMPVVLWVPLASRERCDCKAIVLLGTEIGLAKPKGDLFPIGRNKASLIINFDYVPQLSSAKYCFLVLSDKVIIAALSTYNFRAFRDFFVNTTRLEPEIPAALYTFADDRERHYIDRAAASIAVKSSVAVSVPKQFRFDLQTVVALEHGLFLSGWWIDPCQSIKSVRTLDYSLESQCVSDAWAAYKTHVRIEGEDFYVEKFVAFLPRTGSQMGPAKPLVILEMANGETHTLSAPTASMNPILQRKIIIDHIEERVLDLSLLENIFRPAIAPLHSQINNMQAVERIIEYSSSSMRKVSIVIPLYKNFNFIRSQLFAFSSDPFIRRNCEIIYVNDDPAYGADLISLLEGYRIIFDVDIRLILLQKNGGYSLANNFAVKDANGDVLVLMNSDIVPDGSGWLEGLVKQLLELPKYSVVGPKLLYADNTLQHAGMYFLKHFSGFWQNMHYYKGYGRDFPAANEDRPVGALTGACLVVRKSDFVEVGGFSTEYVIGDYEDSDLCFKLRKMGGICLYSARTALYHFERQSMQSNTLRNDGTTSAYNRALNFSKWKDSGLEAGYLQE